MQRRFYNKNMNCDFVIKNPLWARVMAWVVAVIGLLTVVIGGIVYAVSPYSHGVLVGVECAGAGVAALGILCVYVGYMEKFELKNGVFSYRKPFKRKQSAAVEEIAKVVKDSQALVPLVSDVVFYGKDGKKLIHFYDDGTAFFDGKFESALIELNIPFAFYESYKS